MKRIEIALLNNRRNGLPDLHVLLRRRLPDSLILPRYGTHDNAPSCLRRHPLPMSLQVPVEEMTTMM